MVSRHDGAGIEQTIEEVLTRLREHGGRVTTARRLLLEVIFAATDHLTAEHLAAEVQRRAPDVHLSTIYRNLDELERLGVISHSHLGHGPSTYHLNRSVHTHLVCETCGRTIEAPDEVFDGLADQLVRRFGFVLDRHHFAVVGHCRDCAPAR